MTTGYAVDPSRAEADLGWRAEVHFEEALERTVQWYSQRDPDPHPAGEVA